MAKQNLNKRVMVDLENAGAEGIIPLHYVKGPEYNFDILHGVVSIIQKWESQGKVTRINEGSSPDNGIYVLSKYARRRQ